MRSKVVSYVFNIAEGMTNECLLFTFYECRPYIKLVRESAISRLNIAFLPNLAKIVFIK